MVLRALPLFLAVFGAAMTPPGAAAQVQAQAPTPSRAPAKPADGNDIVVTARKPVEKKEALQFTRAASAPVERQLAKFNRDVCPVAIGFPAKVAERIVDRMRDVADAAGIKVDKPGCKGNMVLLAARDGSDMVREMQRLQTHLIDGLAPREIRAQIASHEPVHSWTLTATQNEYGDDPVSSGDGKPVLEVFTASHMNPPTQQAIQLSVVIIDWPAMLGKTTMQIADYAAMRTLAKTRPLAGSGPIDSILALFDARSAPPPELSEADFAYLRGLYAMPGTRFDYFQIGQISDAVKKAARDSGQ